MPPTRSVAWPLSVEPYWRRVPGAAALLHAIAENPGDDDVRLVLADLCDDVGECARAEFIRAQVAPARLSLTVADAESRAAELLAAHADAWADGLPAIPGVDWSDPVNFVRGLLCGADLPALPGEGELSALFASFDVKALRIQRLDRATGESAHLFDRLEALAVEGCDDLAYLDEILAALRSGNLRRLELERTSDADGVGRLLAAAPGLRKLLALDLDGVPFGREDVESLTASPHLRRLTTLRLTSCDLDADAARALAAWEGASSLTLLNLEFNDLGDDGAEALAASPHLLRLERLYLRANDITSRGATALGNSPTLAEVGVLGLDGDNVGAAGVAALGRRIVVDEVICVTGRDIGDDGLRSLLAGWGGQTVRSLSLLNCGLTDDGFRALAAHPGLRDVRTLDVPGNPVTARGVAALLASPYVGELEHLDIDGPPPGTEGWPAEPPWAWPRSLKTLHVYGAQAGAGWCEFMLRCEPPAALTSLVLIDCGIGTDGVAKLCEAGRLAALTTLVLVDNPIGDAGAARLAACADLRSLTTLGVTGCGVTAAGLGALLSSPHLSGLESLTAVGSSPPLGADDVRRLAAGPVPPALRKLSLVARPEASEAVEELRSAEAFRGVVTVSVTFTPPEPDGGDSP